MHDPKHKHGRFFDLWSRFYRRTPFGWELERIQQLALDRLEVRPGELVLDLGCGPGHGVERLVDQRGAAVGLDYSQGMLETARATPALRGRLVRGDAGRLPFRDGAFQKLLCTNSFHHYPDHLAALVEMRRVLAPGGRMVLVDPRKDHLFGRAAIDFVERVVFGLDEVRIFTVPQWRQMLSDAGFAKAAVEVGKVWQPLARAEVFIDATA